MFDFKGLIQSWITRKGKNPAEDLRSATIWVQELPQADRQEALEDIIRLLQSSRQNHYVNLRERAKALLYLDDKAAGMYRELQRDYLSTMANPDATERLFLPTILAYQEDIAEALQNVIKCFVEDPDKRLWELIPVITARALHYYGQQIRWNLLRYLPGEATVWRYMQRLYLFAERESFAHTPLKLHSSDKTETSCMSEFLQPHMLYLANPDSLRPDQIAQVAFWLESWSQSLLLENEFRPQRQQYVVSMGDSKPARRLRRNMIGEKYRYLSVGMLLLQIEKIMEQLQQGELPARLQLGEDCRLPHCLDLIDLVKQRWAGKGGQRQVERRPTKRSVEAAQGLADIFRHLGSKPGSRPASKPATPPAAHYKVETIMPEYASAISDTTMMGEPELFDNTAPDWIVENESPTGCFATFDARGKNIPSIGTLIGLRGETDKQYAIGIVKRLNKSVSGRSSVGIRILSETPMLVQLDGATTSGRALKALYLAEISVSQTPRTLLLASRYYQEGKTVTLRAQKKAYTIRLKEALEHNQEYARVTFDVLAKLAPGS